MPLYELGAGGMHEIPRRPRADANDVVQPTPREEQVADRWEMFWLGYIYGALWTAFAGTVYFTFFK